MMSLSTHYPLRIVEFFRKMKCIWSCFPNKKSVFKSIDTNCTLLEDLNNDILLDIFDYFSFDEMLISFSTLNTRFSKLIENYPHSISLQSHQIYPNHIRSLKITGSYQISTCFSLQSFQFSSLRAIIFGNLRPEEVLNVLNYLPSKQLECIYVGVYSFDRQSTKLRSLIQTQILTLGQYRLRQCCLKEELSIVINDLPETLFALEYLQITCHDFYTLSQLLARTNNLKYLHVSIIETAHEPLLSNRCYITYLSLYPHPQCSPEELTIFLRKCCPNLNKLIVHLYIYRSEVSRLLVNKLQWMTILPYRLTFFHLKTIPNASVHFFKTQLDTREIPLREKLSLTLTDNQTHYCEVLIDVPFITVWTKNE